MSFLCKLIHKAGGAAQMMKSYRMITDGGGMAITKSRWNYEKKVKYYGGHERYL